MATVNIKWFRPTILGAATAVYGIDIYPPETFTSSASSQVTTNAAPNTGEGVVLVRVVAVGGDIWMTIGKTPTAVTQTGTLLLDGIPEVFKLEKGDKIAIIN